MDVNPTQHTSQKKIGNFLIFFCVLIFLSCKENLKSDDVTIQYKNNDAIAVTFEAANAEASYQIVLKDETTAILGRFERQKSRITFIPVIPFTKGEAYQILKEQQPFLEFSIEKETQVNPPEILGIYPRTKSVPENLLKMYFVFSKPMQQSKNTLDFISVKNITTGKEENIFLSLENELWNLDRTELTLWLDPGRIKKDLIPNKKLGIPIQEGNSYEITVSKLLEDADGNSLGEEYTHQFKVGKRDVTKPNVQHWKLTIPTKDSKEALGITFDDSLDARMIEETIRIFDEELLWLDGDFMVSKKANNLLFIPANRWKKGTYKIIIETKLEDLAGNNLNRLFDHDLQAKEKVGESSRELLVFTIE